jgi:hypothetical protein
MLAVSPTLNAAVDQQRANVAGAGHNLDYVCRKRNRSKHGADLIGLVATIVSVALTELTEAVGTPALHRSTLQDRARVVSVRRDLNCCLIKGYSEQCRAHLVRRVPSVVAIAQAELAVIVLPPTFDRASLNERACVM